MNMRALLGTLAAASIMIGCGTPQSYVASGDYKQHSREAKKIGVIVAEPQVFSVGADGTAVPSSEMSAQSKKCFEEAVASELTRRGYTSALLPLDAEVHAVLSQYEALRPSIGKLYTTDVMTGKPKPAGDQAGLGLLPPLPSAATLAAHAGVDGLVIVRATDYVSSGGRKAMMGALAVFGIGVKKGQASAELAVLDKPGRILFYDVKMGLNYNLTSTEDVSNIIAELVGDMRIAGPQ